MIEADAVKCHIAVRNCEVLHSQARRSRSKSCVVSFSIVSENVFSMADRRNLFKVQVENLRFLLRELLFLLRRVYVTQASRFDYVAYLQALCCVDIAVAPSFDLEVTTKKMEYVAVVAEVQVYLNVEKHYALIVNSVVDLAEDVPPQPFEP